MAVVVNGERIDDQCFIEAFRQLGGQDVNPASADGPHRVATLRRLTERHVVERVLLRQMAQAAGFAVSLEEVGASRTERGGTSSASVCSLAIQRRLTDDLLVEKYCQWLSRHELRPSRGEVEQYYTRHRSEFVAPERVNVEQIVCNIDPPGASEGNARTRIEQAAEELAKGKAFARVADRFSDCGGKAMLGWIERGTMVPEFEEVVFALRKGEQSRVFRTVFGFHIAKVVQKKQAGVRSLEEFHPVLARRMFEERRRRVVEMTTEQALRKARIEVVPEVEAVN